MSIRYFHYFPLDKSTPSLVWDPFDGVLTKEDLEILETKFGIHRVKFQDADECIINEGNFQTRIKKQDVYYLSSNGRRQADRHRLERLGIEYKKVADFYVRESELLTWDPWSEPLIGKATEALNLDTVMYSRERGQVIVTKENSVCQIHPGQVLYGDGDGIIFVVSKKELDDSNIIYGE